MFIPGFEEVLAASGAVAPFIHRTPVLTSRQMDALSGGRLFFKCENFQKVGAFKFRGATNAVINLSDDQRRRGVVTHSSGNHAAALAHAAVSRGVKAFIVMPSSAPEVKKRAVAGYGAIITYCEPTLEAKESRPSRGEPLVLVGESDTLISVDRFVDGDIRGDVPGEGFFRSDAVHLCPVARVPQEMPELVDHEPFSHFERPLPNDVGVVVHAPVEIDSGRGAPHVRLF